MSNIASWLSPELLRTLGWTLLHFLWQGAALAALLAVLFSVFRTASGRYVLAVATLVFMMAAPIVTFAWLLQHENLAPATAITSINAPSALIASHHSGSAMTMTSLTTAATASAATPTTSQPAALLGLVELWFAGVLFLSLRTAGGLLVIEKMRRKDTRPITRELFEKCLELQNRLGIGRFIYYCECATLDAPAVIGWFRPMVLLPATALTGLTEAQIEAVIAHELAHIRRFDGFINLFQIAVETLLFYHPAVWWVSRRIRVERENCCDDAAISIHGDAVDYARALTLMEQWRTAPALAMAINRGPLSARIFRLLGRANSASGTRVAGLAAGLLCLAAALLAGNACLGVAHASLNSIFHPNQDPSTAHEIIITPDQESALAAPAAPSKPTRLGPALMAAPTGTTAPAISPAAAAPSAAPAPAPHAFALSSLSLSIRSIFGSSQDANGGAPAHSYLQSMEDAGFKNVTVDQLIAMKVQGITPEYVKSMRALGFNPDVDELIGMKVQGITPEYVRETREIWPKVDADQLIAIKVQGITPEYVKAMHSLGLKTDIDEIIGMKVQGITPEYVKEIRATWPNADTDQLIGIKVQGITPEYVKSMQSLGLKTDADDIIALKVQGITPEYVKEIRAIWPNADTDEIIAIKVQGITPQYIKEISDLGFKPSADDIIGLKVQGVTAGYIKWLQSAGLGKVDLDEIISAKVQGLSKQFVDEAVKHGFQNLTLEKLIALKNAGVL
jgi:beta-lactamase regulating signal transducer with metallopeptidase domain